MIKPDTVKPDSDTPHYPKTYFNGSVHVRYLEHWFCASYTNAYGDKVVTGAWAQTLEWALKNLLDSLDKFLSDTEAKRNEIASAVGVGNFSW